MITSQVQEILEKLQGHPLNRIYYVSSGESLALLYPSIYIADREAKSIAIDMYNASEFRYRNPVALGEKSVVTLCANDTDDIMEAARFAKEKNAITIGISAQHHSMLESLVDHFIQCETSSMTNSEYSALYQITTGILQEREPEAYATLYQGMIGALENIDKVCQRASIQFSELGDKFAKVCKGKEVYAIASGTNYSQAYFLSQSKALQENRVHVNAIHAGQFIHHPLIEETNEKLFILFLGLDATRELEEQALSLVEKYNDQVVFILDAKTIDFTEIQRAFAKVMPPLVFASVMQMFVKKVTEEIGSRV